MKTKIFFFAMLASVTASAQTMDIKIATINYSTKIATCNLSWTGRNATHLSDVWVFVDFIEISGNTTSGAWQPAAITGATVTQQTTGNVTASTVSGNTRGVWIKSVTSGANFTGQITLQLSGVPAKFNACAYATDYPPNIASVSGGTYTLKGTQSFRLNGLPISGKTYTGSINALTDPTGCPGCIAIRDFDFNSSSVSIPCCPGLTAVGSYCRDLVADDASTFTGCGIEIKNTDLYGNYAAMTCLTGWRFPTFTEIKCMFTNRSALNMSYASGVERVYKFTGGDATCNKQWGCITPTYTGIYMMAFGNRYCNGVNAVTPGDCSQPHPDNGGFGKCVR